jgi:hypothetical protein
VVNLTLATLRRAEFGFLGVEVYTRVQTPLFCGAPFSAGVLVFFFTRFLPLRTNWLIVGIFSSCFSIKVTAKPVMVKTRYVYSQMNNVKQFMLIKILIFP